MTTPTPPDAPTPATPEGTGTESVLDLHRQHMAQLNEAAMTVDGMPPEEESPDAVQTLLGMVAREQAEPRDGFEPVPFWVACVFGGLLAWGGYYIGMNTADFRADVFDRSDLKIIEPGPPPPEPDPQTVDELMKVGQQIYQSRCAAFHQPSGPGQPGQIPPLDGSEWVVGNQASAARLSRIVLYGLSGPIRVKERTFNGQMPSWASLKDYEIAGVITYIRNSWSNKADPDKAKPAVTTALVKAAREKAGTRKGPAGILSMTQEELLKIPLDHTDALPKK